MITSWPSKTYQKRKKHQKRRSEFKNAQQRRSGAGIEEQKNNKNITKRSFFITPLIYLLPLIAYT